MPDTRPSLQVTNATPPDRPGLAEPKVCADCNLLVEADHRIANHLAMLRSYLHLQQGELAQRPDDVTSESARLILANIDAQIVAVSQLHRVLAAQGRRGAPELAEQLHATCAPFHSALSGGITIVENFEGGCRVEPDKVLPLTQIVAEALTNAVKYGRGGGGARVVDVRCRLGDLGDILIEVVDDGPGLPAGFDPMSDGGLGFRLLRGLSKQLGALIAFKSSPAGLTFQLALPPSPLTDPRAPLWPERPFSPKLGLDQGNLPLAAAKPRSPSS